DSLPCAEHHRDDQFASVLPHITRAARKQLGWRVARVRDVRKQIFGIENDSGLEIIVRKKHRLQLSHDRAGDAYHQLLVWVASDKLRISDVLRTGVADGPVDHQHLAMIAEIESGSIFMKQPNRQPLADFHATAPQARCEFL